MGENINLARHYFFVLSFWDCNAWLTTVNKDKNIRIPLKVVFLTERLLIFKKDSTNYLFPYIPVTLYDYTAQ
jgi:hypothetical protein